MKYSEKITRKLRFFKEGENKILERYRSKSSGWLDYYENIIVPKIIDYLKLGLYRDKKTLRISSDIGLLEYELFNLLLGKIYYDGKIWGMQQEDIEILEGDLIVAEILNVIFDGEYKPVILSQSYFNEVIFKNCRFISVDFTNSIFKSCIFENCYFDNCDFQNCLFGATIEELNAHAEMRYRPCEIIECIAKNCAFSTAKGIGSAPFFSSLINDKLCQNIKKMWEGEKTYNLSKDIDILEEIKDEIDTE